MSLIKDVQTRWSTTADSVTRLLEMKCVIRTEECVEHLPIFLRQQDWEVLENIKRVLEPIRALQRVFKGGKHVSRNLPDHRNEAIEYCTPCLDAFAIHAPRYYPLKLLFDRMVWNSVETEGRNRLMIYGVKSGSE